MTVLNKWNQETCIRSFFLGFAAVCLAQAAEASDFAAGGIVIHDKLDIAMLREDLYVSPDLIRVTYVYQSVAETVQNATVTFPMPPVPVEGGADFLGGGEINEADPRNYMHFSVKADGRPIHPALFEHAYVGETEVGELLRAAGLPLLIAPDDASDMIAALPAEPFFALEESKTVSRGGDDPPHFSALWRYQTVYEWHQSFPPGRTVIEISYRPLVGTHDNPGEAFDTGPDAANYCIDDEVRAKIAKRRALGQSYDVETLGYILVTAQYWKGPIGEFNLVVDTTSDEEAGRTTLVALCLPDANPGQYTWSAKNFTPSQDLAVRFYYFHTAR